MVDLAETVNRHMPKRPYNTLAMLQYLLTRAEPGNDWGDRLKALMATLLAGRSAEMGFPADWLDRKLWGGTK